MRPLDDIVVLDLSRVLAGPYSTMYMADMGARVIKIERPGAGDDTRGYGPPFKGGESCYFMSLNRGKKSVAIDMKHPHGLALVRRLARKVDVLVENFRPGTAERLGLGYDELHQINPGLIYVSVSGFGHYGDPEYSQKAGYDLLAQGLSGIQALTGSPDGPPTRAGVAVGDLVAGVYALTGTLAALMTRQRTGHGQHVDVALLDGLISLLAYQAGISLNSDREPRRMGNAHPTICPYDTFRASNGYVNIAAGNDALFRALAKALEIPEMAEDPRFRTNALRVENRQELYQVLEPLVADRSVERWTELLDRFKIPGGPILEVSQTLAHPQALARNMVVSMEHPKAGEVKVTGFPFHLSASPCGPDAPPPTLGQHTDEVLVLDLGLSAEEIDSLRQRNVIA